MRHIMLIGLLTAGSLLKFSASHAAPVENWSYRLGGAGANIAHDIAIDGAGNVVITGTFTGTMNLGGGMLTSAGSFDVFLARFDATGAHQWSRSFGSAGVDGGRAVTVDGAGNITMTGYFRGPASFGGTSFPGNGAQDIFVARFDNTGLYQWSRAYGGAVNDEGQDVITDASGNVIVTGFYGGAVNFGSGAGAPVFGGNDVFILKLDASGAYQWSRCVGGLTNDIGYSIAVDAFNHLVVAGMFNGKIDLGGGLLQSAGASDIFVAKYDENGVHQWSKRLGGSGGDIGRGVGVDVTGSVVVTGLHNYNDVFLNKYDMNGVEQWTRSFNSSSMAESMDLAVSATGTIVVTGYLRGSVDFGGGLLMSAGADDIFIAVCEATGEHRWSQSFGNTSDDWGYGGAFDPSGDFIATGMFIRSVDFGGGPLVSAGSSDVYLVKFQENVVVLDTTPPTIDCPENVQVQPTGSGGTPKTNPAVAAFLSGASASDDTDPAPVITHDAPDMFPLGSTLVTFRAMDATGNHAECAATVTVLDTSAPVIAVELDRHVLWPPNHKLVTVCADVTVSDNGGEATWSLVSITSSEAENGRGDGHTSQDVRGAAFGTPDLCFDLRAERSGNGDGRVYQIVYGARDASGNAAYDTVEVRVPHDMSDHASASGESRSTAVTSVHPNPFNPQTTMEYFLSTDGRVQIEVYDARGSLVRRLVDASMPAGEHRVTWNGVDEASRPVGSGIYFVRMTAGSRADTRKIVLLK